MEIQNNEILNLKLDELKNLIEKLEKDLTIDQEDNTFEKLLERTEKKLEKLKSDSIEIKPINEILNKLNQLKQKKIEFAAIQKTVEELTKPNVEYIKKQIADKIILKEGLEKELMIDNDTTFEKFLENTLNKIMQFKEYNDKFIKLRKIKQIISEISCLKIELDKTEKSPHPSAEPFEKRLTELLGLIENSLDNLEIEETKVQQEIEKIKFSSDPANRRVLESKLKKLRTLEELLKEATNFKQKIEEFVIIMEVPPIDDLIKKLDELSSIKKKMMKDLYLENENEVNGLIAKTSNELKSVKDQKQGKLLEEKLKKLEKLNDPKEDQKKKNRAKNKLENLRKLEEKIKECEILEEKIRIDSISESNLSSVEEETEFNNIENISDTAKELKEEIYGLKEDFKSLPPCAEKTLVNLLVNLKSQLANIPCQKLDYEQELFVLKKQLDEEEITYSKIDDQLAQFRSELDFRDFEKASYLLNKLRKEELTHLNIHELERLVKENKETEKSIINQNIVLFIGNTGAGKSTTLLYLTGREMIKKEVMINGHPLVTIDALVPLKGVTSSYRMKSETRFLHLIKVRLSQVFKDDEESGKIYFCDSPGSQDNRSAEIDIANALSIFESIRKAKSVKIVCLLSGKSIGDKCDGIKMMCQILLGIMPNIKDRIDSLLFMFTKLTPEQDNGLEGTMNSFRKEMKEEQKADKNYVALVEKIQICSRKKNIIKINPLDGKPELVIKKILDMEAIQNPKEAFAFSVSPDSAGRINEQSSLFYKSISLAVDRGDFAIANYGLDKLKFLYEILRQEALNKKYKESVSLVAKKLKQVYDLEISSFNRYFKVQSSLTKLDIDKYKGIMKLAEDFEPYRISHFLDYALEKELFDQNLVEKVKELINQISTNELEDLENVKILDKIALIAEEFEFNLKNYDEALSEMISKIKNLSESIKSQLNSKEYVQFACNMSRLNLIRQNFARHINISMYYNNLQEEFLNEFEKKQLLIQKILRKDKLEDDDIVTLKLEISNFETVKSDFNIQNNIPMEKFQIIDQNVLARIKYYFKKAEEDLKNAFENESLSDIRRNQLHSSLELCLKQMKDIKSISISVTIETSESYSSVINILKGSMDKLKKEIEGILREFHEKTDWKKLKKILVILKNCKWMETYVDNIQSYTMNKIEESIYEYADNLIVKIKEIQLDFSKPAEITIAIELLSFFSSFKQLSNFFGKLGENFEKIKKEFMENMKFTIFDRIEHIYNNKLENQYQNISNKKISYIKYLEVIAESKAPMFLKAPAQDVLNKFKAYLSEYYSFLSNNFQKNLNEIRNFDGLIEENIQKNVDYLYDILTKITTFPKIKDFNNEEDELDSIKLLNEFYFDLESQMSILKSKNLFKECYIKTTIASYMNTLDKFLNCDNKSFRKLHSEYEKNHFDVLQDMETQAIYAIKDYDLISIASIFENFKKRTDPQSKQSFEKIKLNLQIQFNILIKETELEAKNDFPLEPKNSYLESFRKAQLIEANTKIFQSSKISDLLNDMKVENLICDSEIRIKSYLENTFISHLEYIESNELEIKRFQPFENHLNFIKTLIKYFESYKLEGTKRKVLAINDKRKSVIEALEKKYGAIIFDELKLLKDVKNDLSNLMAVNDNKVYVVLLERIEEIIYDKLKIELKKAQNSLNPTRLEKYLEKIKANIKELINDPLKKRLILSINNLSNELFGNHKFPEENSDAPQSNDKLKDSLVFIFECVKAFKDDFCEILPEYLDNFEGNTNLIKKIKEDYEQNQNALMKFCYDNGFKSKEIKLCIEFAESWDDVFNNSAKITKIFQSKTSFEISIIKENNDSPQKDIMVEIVKGVLKIIEKEIYNEIKSKKELIREASIDLNQFFMDEKENDERKDLIKKLTSLINVELDDKNITKVTFIFENLRNDDKVLLSYRKSYKS